MSKISKNMKLLNDGVNHKLVPKSENKFQFTAVVNGKTYKSTSLVIGGKYYNMVVNIIKNRNNYIDEKRSIAFARTMQEIGARFSPGVNDYVETLFLEGKVMVDRLQEQDFLKKLASDHRSLKNRITLGRGKHWISLNSDFRQAIMLGELAEHVNSRMLEISKGISYEDYDLETYNPYKVFTVSNEPLRAVVIKSTTGRIDRASGFFKYILNAGFPLDLSKYGIYKSYKDMEYSGKCILQCLRNSGFVSDISRVAELLKAGYLPRRYLKIIAEMCQIRIHLMEYGGKNAMWYGNSKYTNILKIATHDDHYFINETVGISYQSAKNWKTLDFKDPRSFKMRKSGEKLRYAENVKLLSSYELVKMIVEDAGTCVPLDIDALYEYGAFEFKDGEKCDVVDTIDSDFKGVFCKPNDRPGAVWVFDTETMVTECSKLESNILCFANVNSTEKARRGTFVELVDSIAFDLKSRANSNRVAPLPSKVAPKIAPKAKPFIHRYETDCDIEARRNGGTDCDYEDDCDEYYDDEYYDDEDGDDYDEDDDDNDSDDRETDYTEALLLSHNLIFDFNMILQEIAKYPDRFSYATHIGTTSKLYTVKIYCDVHKITLILRCTLRILGFISLSSFGENGLVREFRKTVCPYGIMTDDNYRRQWIPLEEASEDFEDELYGGDDSMDIFLRNLKGLEKKFPGKYLKGAYFHLENYVTHYCKLDVDVLKEGIITFIEKWLPTLNDTVREVNPKASYIELCDVLTCSNLAKKLYINSGCFWGCLSISSVVRKFISKCVIGGRVMCRDNNTWHVKCNATKESCKLTSTVVYDPRDESKTREIKTFDVNIKSPLADFDNRSCYISSMVELSDYHGGFLKGRAYKIPDAALKGDSVDVQLQNMFEHCELVPIRDMFGKRIKVKRTNNKIREVRGSNPDKPGFKKRYSKTCLANCSGYFVEFLITKVGKHSSFPLTNYRKDGLRCYTNDMVGKIMHLDMVGLKSLIDFQEVNGRILQGYYYNSGRNPRVAKFVKLLYDKRAALKKSKSPLEKVYKLILLSGYGFTVQKEHSTYIDFDSNLDRAYKKFEHVVSIDKVSEHLYAVEYRNPVNYHYNLCHIGAEILSQSKVIMSRVMFLAEDLQIYIFYTDTDSMQIENSGLERLSEEYYKKYGLVLIGSELSQFHSDYADVVKNQKGPSLSNESWFISKKIYHSSISGSDGKSIKHGTHSKMKGISQRALDWQQRCSNKWNGGLYQDLFDLKSHTFNLLHNGKIVFKADYNKSRCISKREIMKRRVSLVGRNEVIKSSRTVKIDSI